MNCVENLDGEIWRYVMSEEIGFWPYMVSDKGRVKSLSFKQTGDEKLLKARDTSTGYLKVTLYNKTDDNKSKHIDFLLHRLVALMFLKPDPNLDPNNLEVNHINEDKTDNRLENLELCDRIHNVRHGTGIKRSAENRKKQVFQYSKDLVLINVFPSVKDASLETGFSKGNISQACTGKRVLSNGYIWRNAPLPTSTNQLSLFPTTETEKKIS